MIMWLDLSFPFMHLVMLYAANHPGKSDQHNNKALSTFCEDPVLSPEDNGKSDCGCMLSVTRH
jgi:hypothetical protein